MASSEALEVQGDRLPALRPAAPVLPAERSIEDLLARRDLVRKAMEAAMKDEVHYGRIPGIDKPTLLKPGAEMLCSLFMLDPEYESERTFDGDHLTVASRCTIWHAPTSTRVASGEGMCSSKEKKYAVRRGQRVCPRCSQPQVRLGKTRDTGEDQFYCWKKKGGCGQTWLADSPEGKAFAAAEAEVPNPSLPDEWNTVVKMANKRALIAAVLNATGASDIFTQDMEPAEVEHATTGAPPVGDYDTPFEAGSMADTPPVVQPPSSWPQVTERLVKYGVGGDVGHAEAAKLWTEQALKGYWPPEGPEAGKQRQEARERMAQVVCTLEAQMLVPADQRVPLRERVQAAVAEAFDGLAVVGPPWAFPGEVEKPSYAEWLSAQGREVDPDDIPF